MKRLRVVALMLLLSWWAVLLVPGAEAEAPEATGWWAATRITPISLPVPTPNDVSPDEVPDTIPRVGGTPLPQLPTVPGQPTRTPTLPAPSAVPPGGLYVAAVNIRADGSRVPLEAVPDEIGPPDPRIPWPFPRPKTPEQVPQQAPSEETTTEVAVSALRLYVGDDGAVGDLVLEYDTVQGQTENKLGTVAVQACPPEIVWTPEEGGPIDSAPNADCSTGLAYGADEGATLRIPMGGLVRDGMLDIVLMPQPGATFQAVFKKPGPKSLDVTHYPRSDDGNGSGADELFFFQLDCNCPLAEVPFTATGTIVGDLLVAPVDPAAFAPKAPVAGRSRHFATDRGGLLRNAVAELEPWRKGVAAAVLTGLVVVYLFLLRPPGLPLPIGPWAGRRRDEEAADAPRGIGRFVRPRSGPHPRL